MLGHTFHFYNKIHNNGEETERESAQWWLQESLLFARMVHLKSGSRHYCPHEDTRYVTVLQKIVFGVTIASELCVVIAMRIGTSYVLELHRLIHKTAPSANRNRTPLWYIIRVIPTSIIQKNMKLHLTSLCNNSSLFFTTKLWYNIRDRKPSSCPVGPCLPALTTHCQLNTLFFCGAGWRCSFF